MKKLMFATAATALLATAAYAQDSRPAPRDGTSAPSFTQGSGQRAGGPANELNTSTGVPGSTTGTVAPAQPMGSGAMTAPGTVGSGTMAPANNASGTPRTGSGQQSGGPAKQ